MTDEIGSTDGDRGRRGESARGEGEARRFIDAVFGALADWRRREICQYFRDADASSATVTELALLVEAYESGDDAERTHEDVVADLRATHLPRLAEVGVVEYDERSDAVRYRDQPTVEKWVEHALAVRERMADEP